MLRLCLYLRFGALPAGYFMFFQHLCEMFLMFLDRLLGVLFCFLQGNLVKMLQLLIYRHILTCL